MTIKTQLDSIDDLPEALQAEYAKGDDGKFHLDVDDGGAADKLKAKHSEAEKHRKNAEGKQKELQDQIDALTEERDNMLSGAVSKDDVEKLEASYKQKLTKRENELNEQISTMQGNLRALLVDNKAQAMASQLSDYPDVLMPHIKARLQADIEDGNAATKVLDTQGNPSADTVEDLHNEIAADARFAPIIRGSKASGGGAEGGKPNGVGKTATRQQFDAMSASQKMEFSKTGGQIAG